MKKFQLLQCIAALGAAAVGHAQSPTYTYYDLGAAIIPFAISGNSLYIAGLNESTSQACYANVSWSGSTPTIGPLNYLIDEFGSGTPCNFDMTYSEAMGVNDNGWVVGNYDMNSTPPWGSTSGAGFVWVTSSNQFIPVAGWGTNASSSPANCVNNNYAVAGFSDGLNEAYVYTPTLGYFLTSGYGGTGSDAYFDGINDYGYACGYTTSSGYSYVSAFVNSSGWNLIYDSSGIPDHGGQATGINNSSHLCGYGSGGAWRCNYPSYVQTITSAGRAAAINDSDYVVGYFEVNMYGLVHAFVSPSGSTIIDLNTSGVVSGIPSGYVLQSATAIDESGNIVGAAEYGTSSDFHGFLLVKN